MTMWLIGVVALVLSVSAARGVTLHAEELWRIGGDSDDPDELFGILVDVAVGASGHVYLLDSQLNEVHVFDADGAFVARMGREGEGPGEFRRPTALAVWDDGMVGVVQRAPGKVVLLDPDGAPAGDIPVGGDDRDTMVMISDAVATPDGLVVVASERTFRTGEATFRTRIQSLDRDGTLGPARFERSETRNFTRPVRREVESGPFALVWSADPTGRLIIAPEFSDYRLDLIEPDGRQFTIALDVAPRARTEAEIESMTRRLSPPPRRRPGNRPPVEVEVSAVDRAVQAIFPRPDGGLWVLGAHGAADRPDGVLMTVRAFDVAGAEAGTVTIHADGDPGRDGIYVIDDRLFVVRGFWDAVLADRGLGGGDDDIEAEPLSVIAYALPLDR